ncbi:MAG: DNA-binding response regulator [Dehalococcoidia bacterium]|nr:MAG: DNA-binding response regulator [Dehalococcoidia bacterium]
MGWTVLVVGIHDINHIADTVLVAAEPISQVNKCLLNELYLYMRKHPCSDIILLDSDACQSTAIVRNIVAYINKIWKRTHTFVFGTDNLKHILMAARGGADGYIFLNSSPEEIIKTICHAGKTREFIISDCLLAERQQLNAHQAQLYEGCFSQNLTFREREVLTLLISGLTNNELASKMNISTETARWHVKNILHKLDMRRRSELIARWHQEMHFVTC